MTSRFGVLSIPLFLIVMLLAYKNYEIWSDPPRWVPKKIESKRGENKPESPGGAVAGARGNVPRDPFQIIAEKNIFTPDRKEFPLQVSAEQPKPVVRPPVVLYGVMIADSYETASIANPGRPLFKGERETKTVKVGDRIGEYQLTKILPDRIVLGAAGDSFEVLLFDPKSPKRRAEVKTPAKPAEIISTQPAPGAPPAPAGSPSPPGQVPGLIFPKPGEPGKVETAPPRPAAPVPQAPDPNLWRGRRPIRPQIPGASGTGTQQ